MGTVRVDLSGLEKLQGQIHALQKQQMEEFCRAVSKELAARLLGLVIPATPVGRYRKKWVRFTTKEGTKVKFKIKNKKVGGTLRRGWTAKTEAEAHAGGSGPTARQYAYSLPIQKSGDQYTIIVTNPVHYAEYVERGHRTRNGAGKGWVPGRYMLTVSEAQLKTQIPSVVERHLEQKLRRIFE